MSENVIALLSEPAAALLKAEPENPTARALIAQQTGLWIPPEIKTYDEAIAWLDKQLTPTEPAAPIHFKVDISERQAGTAFFTALVKGSGMVEITPEKIKEIASKCDCMSDFEDRLRHVISQEAFNQINLLKPDEGHCVFSDFTVDPEASSDRELDYSEGEATSAAAELLRKHHPALFRKLERGEDAIF